MSDVGNRTSLRGPHEDGATCPCCGDLNGWHRVMCVSCGALLVLAPKWSRASLDGFYRELELL